jgi:hypothetical protein
VLQGAGKPPGSPKLLLTVTRSLKPVARNVLPHKQVSVRALRLTLRIEVGVTLRQFPRFPWSFYMSVRKNERGLLFPCECVSAQAGYSDPWAAIAQNGLLKDGTKERVLNCVFRQPKTIARIAKELGLSQPAIHTHVTDMLRSELLRESAGSRKKHPAENYYEPNFPVIAAADRAAFENMCRVMAEQIAKTFEMKHAEMKALVEKAKVTEQGWTFSDVADFFYTSAYRGARKLLEHRGLVPTRKKRKNGAAWIFWGEEPNVGGTK